MNKNISNFKINSLLTLAMLFSTGAWAHGYITSPPSRAALCQQGVNKQCGSVQYEPQSIEGYKGFPEAGPQDRHIASADKTNFYELDEQKASRWSISNVSSGKINFIWKLTAKHKTSQWRYFITKSGWDRSQPLTRNAFELIPFCQFIEKDSLPGSTVTHSCTLPSGHSGYQVILGVWDISDTDKAFYQAIDLNIMP